MPVLVDDSNNERGPPLHVKEEPLEDDGSISVNQEPGSLQDSVQQPGAEADFVAGAHASAIPRAGAQL